MMFRPSVHMRQPTHTCCYGPAPSDLSAKSAVFALQEFVGRVKTENERDHLRACISLGRRVGFAYLYVTHPHLRALRNHRNLRSGLSKRVMSTSTPCQSGHADIAIGYSYKSRAYIFESMKRVANCSIESVQPSLMLLSSGWFVFIGFDWLIDD
jgi:hypothetical protein